MCPLHVRSTNVVQIATIRCLSSFLWNGVIHKALLIIASQIIAEAYAGVKMHAHFSVILRS